MDQKTALVVAGFMNLSASQRNEAVVEINRVQSGEQTAVRESLRKSITGINFGPMPVGVCPCCLK